ncbi:hypothetical protein EPUS_00347 [Endocarpon pusillum Z07020]|uniref:Dynactin subunit 2 n=1 Tax=Endocarpon pusillum (strain Z07020 / HMAS-L-300199) TaxID=1263415 RepID=U1HIZ9_ENDPU|nr:uncharacterized protein EPUS_00347 [Endocarpon pusillum Z07020]ERF70160.1 hypothetical protein EPUS_00347 [Endocarpon pusillum Z07020]
MALSRQKYADLPDIDEDAPEIYETPELTDDASTIQTATQRTTSPAPSDEFDIGRHDPDAGVDRQRLDRGEARRRFEQSRVDARDANFSDSLNGGRGSYIISTRRSRRRRDGAFQEGDESDSEDESLGRKLARLKRETEEVKSELQRREKEKGEGAKEEDDEGVEDGVEALSQMLNGLGSTFRGAQRSNGAAGSKKLASDLVEKTSQSGLREPAPPEPSPQPQPSTLASLATISDRLTAVEGSLGLSTTTPTSCAPILPTLASLTSQITTLSTTLSPSSITSPNATTPPNLNLETLSTRVQDLISQTDQLTLRRRAATQAATELRQARLKAARRCHALEQETLSTLLAYEDQTSKINALYATLPRIQELSPLLPLVLERLRSLQAIHVGAAGVKGDLDAVERQQEEVGRSIEEWKGAVERVEEGLKEGEEIMRRNKEVVEGLVAALEGRLKVLEAGGRGD